jgi:raffinose/stachyose/melibiose transport system permease protein
MNPIRRTVVKKRRKYPASFVLYRVFAYIVFAFVVFVSLMPFIWIFVSSFKTNQEILGSAFSLPSAISLNGYRIAMSMANIPMRFLTSLIVASFATVISVLFYSMAAYVLARFNFAFKNFIYSLLICSILIPGNAMLQPIYTVVNILGLYDRKEGLILVYTGFGMAVCLFLIRGYFQTIPKDLDEAALIDGADSFTIFLRIMVPIAKPAFMSAAILHFIGCWNELLYALMLTSSEANRTLPLTMRYFTNMFSFNYSAMFAALVLCITPTVVIYVILQEQIMESMVAGAIKG